MENRINTSNDAIVSETGIDPVAQQIADFVASMKQIQDGTPEEARLAREEAGNPFEPKPRDLAGIEDTLIPGPGGDLPIRIYRPKTYSSDQLPAMVYFHGGGFVVGSIKSHDTIAQNFSAEAECIVISVEYRLAPEIKYPEPLEDALASFRWVAFNAESLGIDPERIAIGGDSAGANLATVTCMRCRDENESQPIFQLLIYPATDLSRNTSSFKEFANGYFLTADGMRWFEGHYLEDESQAKESYASPLRAKKHDNMPPALIITAGFDPLRDEGKAYADKLKAAGVNVTHTCYTDMVHGFLSMGGGLPQGIEAIKECGRYLKKAFSKSFQ